MGSNAFGHILSISISQWIYFSKWNETGWRLQLLGKACVKLVIISLKRICKLSDYHTGQVQVSVRLLCFETVSAETGIWQVPGSKPHQCNVYWRFYIFSSVPCEWCNSLYCVTVSSSSMVFRPIRKRKMLEKLNLNFAMSVCPSSQNSSRTAEGIFRTFHVKHFD